MSPPPQAFDALAPRYDADFTDSPIARVLRAQVHARLARHTPPGSHALELGCGTGEDALWLAQQRGVHVLATDASPAMLDAAHAKSAAEPLITLIPLDLQNLPGDDSPSCPSCLRGSNSSFDLAFSNFGPLNVLSDWRPLAAWLASCLKPGGIAAFGVMAPCCLWEIAWHAAHLDLKTAFRRQQSGTTFQPTHDAPPLPIHYPSVRRLTRDFAPYFRRIHVQPLGLALPPSDIYPVVEKRPRLLQSLISLDRRLAALPFLSNLADHYWIEFERLAS